MQDKDRSAAQFLKEEKQEKVVRRRLTELSQTHKAAGCAPF
jgi:hypothetical protein